MKKTVIAIFMMTAFLGAAAAADLSVEAQFNVNGKDPAKSFLTVTGPGASVQKDTIDVTTGASKNKGTEVLNTYRNAPDGKAALPNGIQNLLKFGVSAEKTFLADTLNAVKAADGTITIQYLHRGYAFKIVTDKKGVYSVPAGEAKSRIIAIAQKDGTYSVAKEFAPSGTVADLNWAKVWDAAIPAGTLLGTATNAAGKVTEYKTGAVADDRAASATPYTGNFQFTLTGTLLTIKADLTFKK